MGTRREERHSFWSPLASGPAPLAQTLAMATEAFMNHAGTNLQKIRVPSIIPADRLVQKYTARTAKSVQVCPHSSGIAYLDFEQ